MREAALETAARLGATIASDAIWYDGRCNWVGGDVEERPPGSGVVLTSFVALGGDLYGGTAGVGLFLAELATATADEHLRRTALGASAHALARSDELPIGLYAGRLGTALAAARAARLLGAEELREGAARLLDVPRSWWRGSDDFDLISGAAGSIVALLALAPLLDRPDLLERAAALGEGLVGSARRSERGWSWPSPTTPGAHDLTGLSHGAAGAAYALLELHAATGDESFRAAADHAFAYERSWFDPEHENWPDLREERRAVSGRRPLTYTALWCHGAAGIALTRLRASKLLRHEPYRDEAAVAVRTTARLVESWLASGGNFSLCHGLAGNAEVLLEGGETELAHRIALEGIERYGNGGLPWPCGAADGQTPSLFLGLAGIGRFYLRLFDQALPSILLIRPDEFAAA
jgi:lantibiotic biosynthesis protein